MENGKVSFWVKDYKNEGKKKVCVLEAKEFIRRILLHIIPAKIIKIKKKVHEIIQAFFGVNILTCPDCGKDSLRLCFSTFRNGYEMGFQ